MASMGMLAGLLMSAVGAAPADAGSFGLALSTALVAVFPVPDSDDSEEPDPSERAEEPEPKKLP
jgi:hypothetical protein